MPLTAMMAAADAIAATTIAATTASTVVIISVCLFAFLSLLLLHLKYDFSLVFYRDLLFLLLLNLKIALYTAYCVQLK